MSHTHASLLINDVGPETGRKTTCRKQNRPTYTKLLTCAYQNQQTSRRMHRMLAHAASDLSSPPHTWVPDSRANTLQAFWLHQHLVDCHRSHLLLSIQVSPTVPPLSAQPTCSTHMYLHAQPHLRTNPRFVRHTKIERHDEACELHMCLAGREIQMKQQALERESNRRACERAVHAAIFVNVGECFDDGKCVRGMFEAPKSDFRGVYQGFTLVDTKVSCSKRIKTTGGVGEVVSRFTTQ